DGDARGVPAGYVGVDRSGSFADPLAEHLAPSSHLYWMEEAEDGTLGCTEWTVEGHWDRRRASFDGALKRRSRRGDDDLDIARGVNYRRRTSDTDATLMLDGPSWTVRSRAGHPSKSYGSLCESTYTIAETRGDV